jgi:hypothetical protein
LYTVDSCRNGKEPYSKIVADKVGVQESDLDTKDDHDEEKLKGEEEVI